MLQLFTLDVIMGRMMYRNKTGYCQIKSSSLEKTNHSLTWVIGDLDPCKIDGLFSVPYERCDGSLLLDGFNDSAAMDKKPEYLQEVSSKSNKWNLSEDKWICWQHCPWNVNPADLPSRGVNAKQMVNSSLWWNGPEFLKLPVKKWPREQVDGIGTEAKTELVKHPPIFTHTMLILGQHTQYLWSNEGR